MTLPGRVIDGNNGEIGTKQSAVAIAGAGRLDGKFQCIGYLQRRYGQFRRARCNRFTTCALRTTSTPNQTAHASVTASKP